VKDKILEPRYISPAKPIHERNYFIVMLLLIVLFFGYSMWVLHQEAPTIPIVQEWRYYPKNYTYYDYGSADTFFITSEVEYSDIRCKTLYYDVLIKNTPQESVNVYIQMEGK